MWVHSPRSFIPSLLWKTWHLPLPCLLACFGGHCTTDLSFNLPHQRRCPLWHGMVIVCWPYLHTWVHRHLPPPPPPCPPPPPSLPSPFFQVSSVLIFHIWHLLFCLPFSLSFVFALCISLPYPTMPTLWIHFFAFCLLACISL